MGEEKFSVRGDGLIISFGGALISNAAGITTVLTAQAQSVSFSGTVLEAKTSVASSNSGFYLFKVDIPAQIKFNAWIYAWFIVVYCCLN